MQNDTVHFEKMENKQTPLKTSKLDGNVVRELKKLYQTKVLALERKYQFHKFGYSEILESEFNAKPTVLVVGQYSTGKTSFIRNLIGMDYPDIHIGPEPTTDKFTAVVHGKEAKRIMGNALTGVDELPFSGLSKFGSNFLNKFSAAVCPSPILQNMNLIDTPGVLSGEKQRTSRGYDFGKVCRWFAERSDLILLMFDCSKLDISDELKSVIEELRPQEDKVHCVLNKADQLDSESLMRVYGALLWSMGRVFRGAEVTRVYVGSFQDQGTQSEGEGGVHPNASLFSRDKQDLLLHLHQLPNACSIRKVNEMVKRVRYLVVHACLLGHLRGKMPLWGRERAQRKLTDSLPEVFEEVRRAYQLSEGDFPSLEEFRSVLLLCDLSQLPPLDRKDLSLLHQVLVEDIPRITSLCAGVEDEAPGSAVKGEEEEDQGLVSVKPAVFRLGEEGRGGGLNLILGVGFLVLLLALLLASHLDSHSSLFRALGLLGEAIEEGRRGWEGLVQHRPPQ